ncbi:MAG: dodecin family protein [Chitinophagales bacterium]|nr:dodecin domain-containing protein [Bacteroidota bacterium]MCB9227318.1 dodecin domain-containing protein [Chitinophagales bacterium]
MSVLKVLELMSSSEKSWEEATTKAVSKASETIKGIQSAWVKDQSVVVKDGNVKEFRVTLKVTFKVSSEA